jgi:hypothetical protein
MFSVFGIVLVVESLVIGTLGTASHAILPCSPRKFTGYVTDTVGLVWTADAPARTIAWRVPMLTVGMSDTITVRVMISPTLLPGEEVVIPDSIIWHGAVMDTVVTTFQVWLPCEPVTGASFDYTPSEPMVDETITFDATYAPTNATTSTLTCNWDFGGVLKSGNPVIHTYDTAGTFRITLTVANECTIPPVEYVDSVLDLLDIPNFL